MHLAVVIGKYTLLALAKGQEVTITLADTVEDQPISLTVYPASDFPSEAIKSLQEVP